MHVWTSIPVSSYVAIGMVCYKKLCDYINLCHDPVQAEFSASSLPDKHKNTATPWIIMIKSSGIDKIHLWLKAVGQKSVI